MIIRIMLPQYLNIKILEYLLNLSKNRAHILYFFQKFTLISKDWNRHIIPKLSFIRGYYPFSFDNRANVVKLARWSPKLEFQLEGPMKEIPLFNNFVKSMKNSVTSVVCKEISSKLFDAFPMIKQITLETFAKQDSGIDNLDIGYYIVSTKRKLSIIWNGTKPLLNIFWVKDLILDKLTIYRIPDELLEHLKSDTLKHKMGIEHLYFGSLTSYKDDLTLEKFLERVVHLKSIKFVNIHSNLNNNSIIDALIQGASINSLEHFELIYEKKIKPLGSTLSLSKLVQFLNSTKKLHTLSLVNLSIVNDYVTQLSPLPSLTSVTIKHLSGDSKSILYIFLKQSAIRNLCISNDLISDIPELINSQLIDNLQELVLTLVDFSGNVLPFLSSLLNSNKKNFKRLKFTYNQKLDYHHQSKIISFGSLLKDLELNKNLEELYIDYALMEELTSFLKQNHPSIKTLEIGKIGDPLWQSDLMEIYTEIRESFEKNHRLENFKIGEYYHFETISDDIHLQFILMQSNRLLTISLPKRKGTYEYSPGESLRNHLESNQNILSLDCIPNQLYANLFLKHMVYYQRESTLKLGEIN
ncbi:hypothetical protein DLAC_09778 [Tieghemostelium lacteum]|uniref:F-box domain-containing protein n=1 Tax=Tieghemostelium lacteum TaxID=361077 RepID=A0A151Z798_TIELA|nr:hypothetical protein DLAC_09778 [Tieghemostelium lacteum]|eukprot:KYQ89808.1 hypothetical protein DLAC_09778 [Tieghemostelium lacteum]